MIELAPRLAYCIFADRGMPAYVMPTANGADAGQKRWILLPLGACVRSCTPSLGGNSRPSDLGILWVQVSDACAGSTHAVCICQLRPDRRTWNNCQMGSYTYGKVGCSGMDRCLAAQ